MSDTPDPPTAAEAAAPSPPDPPRSSRRVRTAVAVGVGVLGVLLLGLVVWAAVDRDGRSTEEEHDRASSDATTPGAGAAGETTTSASPATTGAPTTGTPTTGGGSGAGGFADGERTIGPDIQAGRYIATGIAGDGCAWARLAGTTGDGVIAAEDHVGGQAIVDIAATDGAFRSAGCGTWKPYTPPRSPPLAAVDQGDWVVGEQIRPGTYLVARTPSCHWTRASGFGHTSDEVIQTDTSAISLEGPMHAQLAAGERFTTQGCGTWSFG